MSETPTPKPAPEKPSQKIQVSWGPIAESLKERFSLFPQPKVAGEMEAFLLQEQSQLIDLMRCLRDEKGFSVLLLLNAVEYKECLQVIYQLQSVEPYSMLFVKVNLPKENSCIQSVTQLWGSADWFEREIWDMQGIVFDGHPNLKRILNPDNWEGFPLRKNYIPPIDALNGPITAVKDAKEKLAYSTRQDVEVILEPNL